MLAEPAEWRRKLGQAFGSALFLSVVVLAEAAQAERTYASIESTFRGIVDYDRKLLQTNGDAKLSGKHAGMVCHIAAVRLSTTAAQSPPRKDNSKKDFLQFGGNWKKTPASKEGPTGKDLIEICEPYLRGSDLADRMAKALETPGGYFVTDLTGSVLQIYSFKERLAVLVQYRPKNPD